MNHRRHLLFCFVLLFAVVCPLIAQEEENSKEPWDYKEFQAWSSEISAGIFAPRTYPLNYYGVGWFPRYSLVAPKEYLAISAGAPMHAGLDLVLTGNGNLIQYMIDVPLVIDFNFGARATDFDDTPFGVFIGGGLGYNFSHFTLGDTKLNIHTFGMLIHGGFRWRMNGRDSGVRIAFLSGFSGPAEEVNGIIVEDQPGNKILSLTFLYGI